MQERYRMGKLCLVDEGNRYFELHARARIKVAAGRQQYSAGRDIQGRGKIQGFFAIAFANPHEEWNGDGKAFPFSTLVLFPHGSQIRPPRPLFSASQRPTPACAGREKKLATLIAASNHYPSAPPGPQQNRNVLRFSGRDQPLAPCTAKLISQVVERIVDALFWAEVS